MKTSQSQKHSLIKSLVLHSALPEVLACLRRGRKVCQDDLFVLHVENENVQENITHRDSKPHQSTEHSHPTIRALTSL